MRSTCIYESFIVSLQKIMIAFAQQMDWQTALYRVGSYLRHLLTARNTGGHGIHSPYLFEWVRMVMSDENSYYAWDEIEKVRAKMLADEREVAFVDYGAGRKRDSLEDGSGAAYSLEDGSKTAYSLVFSEHRRVCDIAKGSLAKKRYAQMLARLVNWLGGPLLTSPSRGGIGDWRLAIGDEGLAIGNEGLAIGNGQLTIVELGTSLGITTAYMAAMDKRNRVISYEGCPAVAEIAKANWQALGIKNIECRVGEIDVATLANDLERVDVAFVDANHTYAGTRAYFKVLVEKVHRKSVLIVDDIHYNAEMEQAWREICADDRVTSTMDLYQMGIVFFDPDYWKRDYRIRV